MRRWTLSAALTAVLATLGLLLCGVFLIPPRQLTSVEVSRQQGIKTLSGGWAVPPELLPQRLWGDVDKKAVFSAPQAADGLRYHWLITSCDRHLWGRMMSHTLLTALANGITPVSISIMWCRTPSAQDRAAGLPSLLYNLRHSHTVNVLFPSEAMAVDGADGKKVSKLWIAWLSVPTLMGAPDLPLLLTEDDIAWVPDAGIRLNQAVAQIPAKGKEPWMLVLYSPNAVGEAPRNHSGVPQPEDDMSKSVLPSPKTTLQRAYFYGNQGFLFSPGMAAKMGKELLEVVRGKGDIPGLQDMVLKNLIGERWKCDQINMGCHVLIARPSLIQHLGTSSAFFSTGNKTSNPRFHSSEDFPVRLRFPGFDDPGAW